MLRNVNQPDQDGIRVHLEYPGDGTNAQPFRQRTHRPHQPLGHHTLAMQRRAVGLLEIAPTARAMPLAPRATVGMAIGTDIAQPHPAPIGTGGMRAEVPRGVHLARAATRGDLAGGWATGWLGCGRVGLLTGGTGGLAGEARKRLRDPRALTGWWYELGWPLDACGVTTGPGRVQHAAQ